MQTQHFSFDKICCKEIEPATLLSHCLCLDLRKKCDRSEGMRLWRWPSWNYLCINQTRPKSCGIFVWFKGSKSGGQDNKRNRAIDHSSNLWLYKTIVSVEAPFHWILVKEKRENDIFSWGPFSAYDPREAGIQRQEFEVCEGNWNLRLKITILPKVVHSVASESDSISKKWGTWRLFITH